MIKIACVILFALFALWLIGKLIFWASFFIGMEESPDPAYLAHVEAQKAEWDRLKAVTTPDATKLLLPRLTQQTGQAAAADEERTRQLQADMRSSRAAWEAGQNVFSDFTLPSPDPWQLRR